MIYDTRRKIESCSLVNFILLCYFNYNYQFSQPRTDGSALRGEYNTFLSFDNACRQDVLSVRTVYQIVRVYYVWLLSISSFFVFLTFPIHRFFLFFPIIVHNSFFQIWTLALFSTASFSAAILAASCSADGRSMAELL